MTHPTSTTPHLPILPPSPLGVGQAISSTFTIYKQRFGLFVGVALVPLLVAMALGAVVVGALAAAFAGSFAAASAGRVPTNLPAFIVAAVVLALVWGLVTMSVAVKFQAMLYRLAFDTAAGGRPSMVDLRSATSGVVGRALPLLALLVAGAVLLYAAIIGLAFATLQPSLSGSSRQTSNAIAAFFGVFGLIWLVFVIAGLYFGTRLIYWQASLALEGTNGFAALGSSWRLTAHDFWRTLGWNLLFSLLLSFGTNVVMTPVQLVFFPAVSATDSRDVGRMIGSMIAGFVIYLVVLLAVEAIVLPLQTIYITVMYLDQRRRNEMTAAGIPLTWGPQQSPMPGYPGALPGAPQPGYAQHPGYSYGTPPQQPGYGAAGQPFGTPQGTPPQQSVYGTPPTNPFGPSSPPFAGQPPVNPQG